MKFMEIRLEDKNLMDRYRLGDICLINVKDLLEEYQIASWEGASGIIHLKNVQMQI